MLSQLVDSLNLNSPLDVAVAACAVTAFWGQYRTGIDNADSFLERSSVLI